MLSFSLLVVFCLTGCAEDSNILDNGQSRQLEFSVKTYSWNNSSNSKKDSRATPISGNTFDTSKNFNIIADVNKGGSWSSEVDNETASYSTANNIWQTSDTHYWSGTGSTVNFYAYYPTSILNNITHTTGSTPVLSYTVPDNETDQIDILASSKTGVAGNSYTQIPVDFKHIFAAIQFKVGSSGLPDGTITGITLNNIQYKGTFSLDGTWTPDITDTKSFSQTVSVPTSTGTAITSGTTTFMMMPQTLGSDASITITYSNGGALTKAVTGTWEAGKTYTYNLSYLPRIFSYTGSAQSYIAPVTGTYKIECWGASASGQYNPGRGGYTMGYITLTKGTTLYVYVGQQGQHSGIYNYNGGGLGETGGGGASDIRLTSGSWNDFNSLKSRIMVAGGGGGGYYTLTTKDGICPDAGGLKGTDAYCIYADGITSYSGHGGTQTAGGKCGSTSSTVDPYTPDEDGHFGWGGFCDNYYSSGGGGGYYGGGHGVHPGAGWTGGGGGSSFISGYSGCNAISKSSTSTNIIHTGSPNHYSGYVFSNMQMIAGDSSMPAPSGGTETGHTGNGYARITFVSAN